MNTFLNKFLKTKNKEQFLNDIQNLSGMEKAHCLAILGGEYLQENDKNNALVYLLQSSDICENGIAAYNLGYLYENEKNENEMIKYYTIAMKHQIYQAYNQLGRYYLHQDIIPIVNKTPKELLTVAKNNKIIPAMRNLISLCVSTKKYADEISNRIELYLQTNKIEDLMNLMLAMLNKGDYFRYVYTMKTMKHVSFNSLQNLNKFYESSLIEHKCTICFESSKCLQTTCKHMLCTNCMNNIIINDNPKCPYCRSELFIKN